MLSVILTHEIFLFCPESVDIEFGFSLILPVNRELIRSKMVVLISAVQQFTNECSHPGELYNVHLIKHRDVQKLGRPLNLKKLQLLCIE